MLGRLVDLNNISSIGGEKVIEMELEEPLSRIFMPSKDDTVVFVGRFCDDVVLCVGKILEYEEVTSEFSRLKIEGVKASFSCYMT